MTKAFEHRYQGAAFGGGGVVRPTQEKNEMATKPRIQSTSAGLRDALFDAIEKVRDGDMDAQDAQAIAKLKQKLPSTAVGRRRLLKGAALLEADAQNRKGIKFDFSTVGFVEDKTKPLSCNTVGCALGLFAVSEAFKREGVSLKLIDDDGYIQLCFGRTRGSFAAAAKFFEITPGQSTFLFASTEGLPALIGARAERAVAKRIRDFVAGKAAA